MNYISLQKRQLLDSLENQARFSQLMAVVIGEHGIGKSLIANKLLERLSGDLALAPVEASIDLSQTQLEKTIRLQLGLPWQDSEHSVSESLHEQAARRSLLLIDDAHLLSENCLNYLLSLVVEESAYEESCLFVLLLGESSLAKKLGQTTLLAEHPELCVVLEIEPVNENEILPLVAEFQDMNTELAGRLFPPQRISYFFQLSKGNPGELNAQLARWLEARQQDPAKQAAAVPVWRIGSYLLLAIFFFALVYFQSELSQIFFKEQGQSVSSDSLPGDSSASSPNTKKHKAKSGQTQPEQKTAAVTATIQKESNPAKTQSIKAPSAEGQLAEVQSTDRPNTSALSENTTPVSPPKPSDRIETKSDASMTEAQQKPVENAKDAVSTPVASDQQKVNETTTLLHAQQDRAVSQPGDTVVQSSAKKDPNILSDDEAWLTLRDSEHFTLQWAALSQQKAARELALEYHQRLPSTTFYLVRRQSGGRILWCVVSGDYRDKISAQAQAGKLAVSLGVARPWAKSFQMLQQALPTSDDHDQTKHD